MNFIVEYVAKNFIYIALALVGIPLLLFLSLLAYRFFRQKLDDIQADLNFIRKDVKTALKIINDNHSQGIENTTQLQTLASEITDLQASFNRIIDILQDQECKRTRTPPQDKKELPQQPQSELSEPMHLAIEEFCGLYNTAVKDPQKRKDLRARYDNHYPIGVINATDRRRNSKERPIFKDDTSGYFLAFYIKTADLYAVVPAYDLTLQESIYGPGAFGEVFECPNFNPQRRYRHVKVIQPAFFKPDFAQQQWTLKERGELDLDSSE